MSSAEDNGESSGEENQEEYNEGGNCIIQNGDLLFSRYRALRKLGWGNFSTVWLTQDQTTSNYLAIKVVKSMESYTEAAREELRMLKAIKSGSSQSLGYNRLVHLIDEFQISGINGTHICMVFEVLGFNLLHMIKKTDYKGLGLQLVKKISRDILEGLQYLHSNCGIIHTDIKPENVMAVIGESHVRNMVRQINQLMSENSRLPKSMSCNVSQNRLQMHRRWLKNHLEAAQQPTSIHHVAQSDLNHLEEETLPSEFSIEDWIRADYKIVDFGNAIFLKEQSCNSDIQTRQYRSIEVLMGLPFNYSTDIWSTACMIFELITGDYLFNPRSSKSHSGCHGGYSRDEDHIARIIELNGPISKDFLSNGTYYSRYFNNMGRLRNIKNLRFCNLTNVLTKTYKMTLEDARNISDFLQPMLHPNPQKRYSALDCLNHQFLKS